jgi:hypothetical protein
MNLLFEGIETNALCQTAAQAKPLDGTAEAVPG